VKPRFFTREKTENRKGTPFMIYREIRTFYYPLIYG
jgi:hypothetical protein